MIPALSLLGLRLTKLGVALTHPKCWRALACGVVPAVEHLKVLRGLEMDGILDVGSNRGQFSLACRIARPGVPIVAFEPIPQEAAVFHRIHGQAAEVRLEQLALGEQRGEAVLHLSGRADSSSLLPIGELQKSLFRETAEIGTLRVKVQRLDDLAPYWAGRTCQLLKLDVQGFELNVLRGAEVTLAHCAYVYAECSEVPLYDGQALRPAVEAFLAARGFELTGSFNPTRHQGQLIQSDCLFHRVQRHRGLASSQT